MSVKDNINSGKYLPVLPYAAKGPLLGEFGCGDYKHLAIAKVDVYPPGYDPFSDDNKNKQKVKPVQEYYLDLLTPAGALRYRLNVADRKEAEEKLFLEVARIEEQFRADLADEFQDGDSNDQLKLFNMAWRERLKGFHAVADRYTELHPLIA